jgi:2,5-diketo-D-gluconate reductase B
METIAAHGMSLPKLGLGTWRLKGAECQDAVERALALGYRHIDTAAMYGNEEAVGAGLQAGGIPREQVHVTSKVWYDNLAPDAMARSMDASLKALRLDHLDLFLIHWPAPDMDLPRAIEGLVRLKEQGKARAIGVSNFPVALLRRAVEEVGAPIACNQVEYHVLLDQSALLDYARPRGIVVTAYAPLAQGRLAEHAALRDIARKHQATPAQVALKFLLDQDLVAAIPKAGRRENQQANLDALRITLDDEDRAAIARLPKDQRFVNPAWAPAWDRPKAA